MSTASIALNRFGLGARAGEAVPADPRGWLAAQLQHYDPRPAAIAAIPSSASITRAVSDQLHITRAARQEAKLAAMPAPADLSAVPVGATMPAYEQEARAFANNQRRQVYATAVAARVASAVDSLTPFVERLVHFWSNHFAVSADSLTTFGLVGPFEFEAIRPHVLGRFRDMLQAAEHHPAMLAYLNQSQSFGPNSRIGSRGAAAGKPRFGLNENLAREIMELHTLGVRTGYTQADVTEFARALTGWTISGYGRHVIDTLAGEARAHGSVVFIDELHEPGSRTIMGKIYAEPGAGQSAAILDDLAASPATALHLAAKLARHFAGDTPPDALVGRLQAAYLRSDGDLPTLYRVLIEAPEAWVETPVKFKSPWEWAISSMRMLGPRDAAPIEQARLLQQLGEPVWTPKAPAGFDDIAAAWAAPDGVMRRVEAAERMAGQIRRPIDARALAEQSFPGAVSPTTRATLAGAESSGQALALLLLSPEAMRR